MNSSQKVHRKRQAGSKVDKKKKKTPSDPNLSARQRNPKAFAYHSVNKVARQVRRFVVCLCCTLYYRYIRLFRYILYVICCVYACLITVIHCMHIYHEFNMHAFNEY